MKFWLPKIQNYFFHNAHVIGIGFLFFRFYYLFNMYVLSIFHQVLTSIIAITVFQNEFNHLRNSTVFFSAKLIEKRKIQNIKILFLYFQILFLKKYISEVAAIFCLVLIQSTQLCK